VPSPSAGEGLLAQLDEHYQLHLVWAPSRTQPVDVVFLQANDTYVARDRRQLDSPALYSLPAPDAQGRYRIAWAIAPEVDLTGLALVVVRTGTGARTVVASAGATARGDLWQNQAGVTVDAP
jgi:hypothetical protein